MTETVFPKPRDDDDDDVAWNLQTAGVQWDRGAHSDALVWLGRAVQAAQDGGLSQRAAQLEQVRQGLERASRRASEGDDDLTGVDVDLDETSGPRPAANLSQAVLNFTQPGPHDAFGGSGGAAHDAFAAASAAPADGVRPAPDSVESEPPLESVPHRGELATEDVAVDQLIVDADSGGEAPADSSPEPAPALRAPAVANPAADLGQIIASVHPIASSEGLEPVDQLVAPSFRLKDPAAIAETHSPRGLADSVADLEEHAYGTDIPVRADTLSPGDASAADEDAQVTLPPLAPDRGREYEDQLTEAYPPAQEGEPEAAVSQASVAPETEREGGELPEPEAAPAADAGAGAAVSEAAGEVAGESLVDGIELSQAPGFEDLPEAEQQELARVARIEVLDADEEIGFFGAALVTRGRVDIMPAFADEPGAFAAPGDVVFTQGSLPDGMDLRVVASEAQTAIAVWTKERLDQAMSDCPWVADDLRMLADRYQALTGVTLGALGERLDRSLRDAVTSRMEVRSYGARQTIVPGGRAVGGLVIVGGGRVEIVDADGKVTDELGPGDFLFPSSVTSGGAAPDTARAGSGGALVLFASRNVAHELMTTVPPLLEILAGGF